VNASIPLSPELLADVVALRRDLHQHPELGFEEQRTASIVAERLRQFGYTVTEGVGKTGVVGVLRGIRPGKTIMLRADMDGLPIEEENPVTYASRTPGVMHACGHDGHVAMLVGAAEAIARRKADLAGTIVMCFQPAEEGRGGAKAMLEDGLLERFGIERAYGLHLASAYPTGTVALRPGPFYASSDSIEIVVEGRGGHGAAPHLSVDPIYVAAQFVVALQQVVGRQIDPLEPAVVTIGAIHAGTTHNVIPSRATMLGTVRAFNPDVRAQMAEKIERVLAGVCATAGATYTFDYLWRYPVTSNDAQQSAYIRSLAQAVLGVDRVFDAAKLMGAEDFSFYAERVPACFYTVGCSGGPESSFPHHHARFDIDERALEVGVRMAVAIALDAPEHAP
jgi:amidohydrolase